MKTIYLDHNATSPPSKEHLEELFSILSSSMGNPSSPHSVGRGASVALTKARRSVARALGVDVANLIFVSGATEANNLATTGVLRYLGISSSHSITSSIEHPSVLEPLAKLRQKEGLNLTLLNPTQEGFILAKDVVETIRENTSLISIMAANNEVGTIQPVKLIGDFLHYKRWGILPDKGKEIILELEKYLSTKVTKENLQKLHFHVDAVQAFGKIENDKWFSQGLDSVAISGHKLGALQGVGALFLRQGRKLDPILVGGAQEKNRRAGTENLPGVVSFGLVCEKVNTDSWREKILQINALRLKLYESILSLPHIIMNSPKDNVLPNTINFSVYNENNPKYKNGEDVLLELDLKGICASSGSACSSGANLPSKVLLAMGKNIKISKNALRLSLSHDINEIDILYVIEFFENSLRWVSRGC